MKKIHLDPSLFYLTPVVCNQLIRVGRDYDGGYVLPDFVITDAQCCISMGLSNDWSFEIDCKKMNPSLAIHAYDFSISKKKFIKKAFSGLFRFIFLSHSFEKMVERVKTSKSYLNFFQKDVIHYENRVYDKIDGPLDITVDQIFSRTDAEKILVKVDIEGSEYRIIDDLLKYVHKIDCLAIEFHDTHPLRLIFEQKIKEIQRHFEIVHLHANNCAGIGKDGLPEVLEITFLKKNLLKTEERRLVLPLQNLDMQNSIHAEDIQLIFTA